MKEGGEKKPTHESDRERILNEIKELELRLMEVEVNAQQMQKEIQDVAKTASPPPGLKEALEQALAHNMEHQDVIRKKLAELKDDLPRTLN